MTRVYLRHVRAIELPGGKRLCAKGMRQWAETKGIAWSDFLRNGVDADFLIATGDHWAVKAAEIAAKDGDES